MPNNTDVKRKLIALRLTEKDFVFAKNQANQRHMNLSTFFRHLLNKLRKEAK